MSRHRRGYLLLAATVVYGEVVMVGPWWIPIVFGFPLGVWFMIEWDRP